MVMFVTRFLEYFTLCLVPTISVAAAPWNADSFDPLRQSINAAKVYEHNLLKRDLPPCTPCPKKRDVPDPMDEQLAEDAQDTAMLDPLAMDNAQDTLDQELVTEDSRGGRIYPANYIPPICNHRGINCMYLAKGVKFVKGGLHKPIAHWYLADGGAASEIWAWRYWQSTLLFTKTGGSCTTYPAHCTVYTCCKGAMFAHIYDDNADVRGNGDMSDNAPNVCHCFYHLDTDQYFG